MLLSKANSGQSSSLMGNSYNYHSILQRLGAQLNIFNSHPNWRVDNNNGQAGLSREKLKAMHTRDLDRSYQELYQHAKDTYKLSSYVDQYIADVKLSISRFVQETEPSSKRIQTLKKIMEVDQDLYERGLKSRPLKPHDSIDQYREFLELKPSPEQEKLFTEGLDLCIKNDYDLLGYISHISQLIGDYNIRDRVLKTFNKAYENHSQRHTVGHGRAFLRMASNDITDAELDCYDSILELSKSQNQCASLVGRKFSDLIADHPDEARLKTFNDYIDICKEKNLNLVLFLHNLNRLIPSISNDDKLRNKLDNFISVLEFFSSRNSSDPGSNLLNQDKLSKNLASLELAAIVSPQIDIGIRNLVKAIEKGVIRNIAELRRSFLHLTTISYQELNRRGLDLEKAKLWEFLKNTPRPPLGPLFRVSSGRVLVNTGHAFSRAEQINTIHDFGLDIFHGYEALTQAARPFRNLDHPVNSLLERTLSHLTKNPDEDSYALNCSKPKHTDTKFPGISWHFENLEIPEIQKQILEQIPEEDLGIVDIESKNFDDLERTDVTLMRGGIILDTPEIVPTEQVSHRPKDHSIIIYNDHFDNPTNTVMLLVPSEKIRDKINACKIKLKEHQGFNPKLPDILDAGLDAKTLLEDPETINLLSPANLRAGFNSGHRTGYSHEYIYQVAKNYMSVWRKLQLAMTLYEKGFVDPEKYDFDQIRADMDDDCFNYSNLMLNEVYNWREWFLKTSKEAATPVLIDSDPFRYSDARAWNFKLDPSAEDGVKLTVLEEDGSQKVLTMPDIPKDAIDREEALQTIRTIWGTEIYPRIYNQHLTRSLKFYNKRQIKNIAA